MFEKKFGINGFPSSFFLKRMRAVLLCIIEREKKDPHTSTPIIQGSGMRGFTSHWHWSKGKEKTT